jgi:hypothetical protein
MARRASLWVVIRSAPAASSWSDELVFYADRSEKPVGIPLCGFTDKKAAEAARQQLERQARETIPINLFFRSKLPEGLNDITAAAKVAKLPLPDFSAVGPPVGPTRGPHGGLSYGKDYSEYSERVRQAVRAWWASVAEGISPETNATLWDELYPNLQFYKLNRVLFET